MAARVDNVTKFQLFAEQRPLSETAIVPLLSPPLCSALERIRTICSVLGYGYGCGSCQSGKPQSDVPQNFTAKLHQLARRIDADSDSHTVAEDFAVQCSLCGVSVSRSLFVAVSLPSPPLLLACTKHTPNAKRASTHVVHYYPLYANANRITFNMLPDHN